MRAMAPATVYQPEEHPAMRGMVAITPRKPERHDVMRVMAREIGANGPVEARFATAKHSATATALSFLIPGAGQIYNGDVKKGVVLLALTFVAFCLTVYAGVWFLGIPLSLGAWGWGIMDAAKVARRERALW
jgi:TM2 domain-containing membrane protein YozV